MSKIIPYSYLIFLLVCSCSLTKCKSDIKKVEVQEMEPTATNVAKLDQINSQDSNTAEIKGEDTTSDSSELSTEVESTTAKTIQKDSIALNKNVQKPIEVKPSKTLSKNKTVRVVNKNKPKIEFEELVWNFGEITEGDVVEKKFKFTNTGNAPLEIIATSATCGCTRPSFPFLDIAPGESNVIGVTYNSVGKDGAQNAEITVESNTESKITIIKLKGIVNPKPKKEK